MKTYYWQKSIIKLELSMNAIHTPTNVPDKAGTRVRRVLHIASCPVGVNIWVKFEANPSINIEFIERTRHIV